MDDSGEMKLRTSWNKLTGGNDTKVTKHVGLEEYKESDERALNNMERSSVDA